ncbi:MAG: anti-sigma F factor [Lachnospiraceae bacterium]|nr:anti-sigma F factor [Lachnospiraceae bacterium]
MQTNEMTLEFDSKSENEGFARVAVAAFASQLDPTLEEIADIKTAVSEAVTNAIIHGYENKPGRVRMECKIHNGEFFVTVSDKGKGIEDIEQAMEPLFTTKPELERSGMGFVFMDVFMDALEVLSIPGEGCTVRMKKKIGAVSGKNG